MTPMRFGNGELVGMLHRSEGPPSGTGVLLCPPFGQEQVRTHRMLRVLGERLARAGHTVLRFDWYGTGDSLGDDEEASLTRAVRDVLSASDALLRAAGCPRERWVGLRLGATAALRAAALATRPPERLVLCDPIVDGSAYLDALQRAHRANLERSYSLRAWQPPPADGAFDASGFAVGEALQAELRALRLPASTRSAVPDTVLLLTPAPDTGTSAAIADAATRCLGQPLDWQSEEAIDGSLVPPELLAALAREAGDGR